MMAAPGGVKLYFFQQKRFRQPPKRYRKLPEDLPQSLRFSHLNPKVAAFLANKEKVQRQTDEADGLLKTSLLPEITQSFQHLRSRIDSLLENDEDSQRFLYEEARLSAPGVLSQLAKYLYTLQGINTCIPKSLEYLLLMGWKEITADVTPVPREWQTAAMREAYPPTQSSEDPGTSTEPDDQTTDKLKPSDSDVMKMKISDRTVVDPAKLKLKANKSFIEDEDSKRKNDKSTSHVRPKMKHGRLKSIGGENRSTSGVVRSPGSQRGSVSTVGENSPAENRYVHNTYSTATIQFQLSSQVCKDKGWVVRETNKDVSADDVDPPLELAVQILQSAIKKAKEEAEQVESIDLPVKIRYYKDLSQAIHGKYAKPKPTNNQVFKGQRPTIPSMWSDDGKNIMQAAISDGSTTIFYPSGRPAILSSQAGFGRPGYYTLVYGDEPGGKLLACFTPAGRGVCMFNNGNVRFQVTKKGGHTADPDGKIVKKWKWPKCGMKLPGSINVQVSPYMTLRCFSQAQVYLHFSCQKETAKFNLGPVPGAVEPQAEEDQQLLTSFSFSSKSASDLNQIFSKKPVNKAKKKKDRVKAYIAEAQKLLDDQDESDPDAVKDLNRLQRKARILVDNWMEHYRIYIGLGTGSLKYMREVPDVRKRNIQSAKISSTTILPVDSKTEVEIESPDPIVKLRTPSAPASSEVRERLLNRVRTAGSSRSSPEGKDVDETDSKSKEECPRPSSSKRSPAGSAGKRPLSGGGMKSLQSIISHTAPLTTRANTFPVVQSGLGQCPVSLRAELLGFERPHCRCSRHHVPYISDIEFDNFLKNEASMNQMIIIAVVSTLFPDSTPGEAMIEKIHTNQNRNRTRPCVAARYDAFRILQYDVASAAYESDHTQPMLLARHNVVPGMFLIYHNGSLVFCDHIFNGYGNAKKDFRKQIMKCRADAIHHRFLPKDFHFSPGQGRTGPRAAWGGQMGGAGVDHYGNPGMTLVPTTSPISRRPDSASSFSTEDRLQSLPASNLRGSDAPATVHSVSFASNPSGEYGLNSQLQSRSGVFSSTSGQLSTG